MKTNITLAAGLLASILFTGCAPVKILDVVEIKPNETAWAIPLDAMTQAGQAKVTMAEKWNGAMPANTSKTAGCHFNAHSRHALEYIPA